MIEILTDEEMRNEINRVVTLSYPKMLKDFKRITSYNYIQYEDLLPFCLSEFLIKKPIDYQFKVCVTDNKLVNYMGRSMSMNLKSSTSPYWSHYRKQAYNSRGSYLVEYQEHDKHEQITLKDPDITLLDENPLECVMYALEQIDFYHRTLLDEYYLQDKTYKDIREKFGIPLYHIRRDIENGVKLLQQYCKHFMFKK